MFGLVLIVSSIFSLIATYTSSLDRKILYTEAIISLETKAQRNKADDDLLSMNAKLIEVTRSNEYFASAAVGVSLGISILLSLYGAIKWHREIQQRDDKLATLQLEKLEVEIEKLRSEFTPLVLKASAASATPQDDG